MLKGRLEDARMLTGRGRYVSDWNLPGQAYGHFLRSDRAHAKIVSIQKEEALKSRGVIAVITGSELVEAGLKPLPAAAPFKWQDGSDQRPARRLSPAHMVVRHAGEPVALILAGSDTPAHGVGPMRGQRSAVLGVPREKVRVVAEEVGGGFGVRFNAYPEYGALLYAAKKLGRPVKWVGTRSEVFLGDEQARDIVHTGEMALDANGRILGMRFDYLSNMGAYVAFTVP